LVIFFSLYAWANLLSVCRHVTAAMSCVIGCMVVGKLAMRFTTWAGSSAREFHSADTARTCVERTGVSHVVKLP